MAVGFHTVRPDEVGDDLGSVRFHVPADVRRLVGSDAGVGRAIGGGADICVQHPHNFYMQAAVEGGVPGLVLFGALAVAWLTAIGRGLRGAGPLRTGLFIATAIHLWPIAGNTDWVAMPLAGYFFVQLGLALTYASEGSSKSIPL